MFTVPKHYRKKTLMWRCISNCIHVHVLTKCVMKQLSLSISQTAWPPGCPSQLSLRSRVKTLVLDCQEYICIVIFNITELQIQNMVSWVNIFKNGELYMLPVLDYLLYCNIVNSPVLKCIEKMTRILKKCVF